MLLAQSQWDSFRGMGGSFRGDEAGISGREALAALAFLLGLLGLVVAGRQLLDRQDRRRRLESPRGVFDELCSAHQLDRASRRLLWRICRRHDLADPAAVFLRPELLTDGKVLNGIAEVHAARLRDLRERLYRGLEDEERAATATEPADPRAAVH
jgi:hypothetical protein